MGNSPQFWGKLTDESKNWGGVNPRFVLTAYEHLSPIFGLVSYPPPPQAPQNWGRGFRQIIGSNSLGVNEVLNGGGGGKCEVNPAVYWWNNGGKFGDKLVIGREIGG